MFLSTRVTRLRAARGVAAAAALLALSSVVSPVAASAGDAPPAVRTSQLDPSTRPAKAPATQDAPPPVSRLIVKYRPGAQSGLNEAVIGASSVTVVGLSSVDPIADGVVTVELTSPVELSVAEVAAQQLASDARVEYAEPDRHRSAYALPAPATTTGTVTASSATSPTDSLLSQQWPLVGEFGIRASGAWARATGSGVVVAVLDSGLAAHPDLAGQTVAGYDMASDPVTRERRWRPSSWPPTRGLNTPSPISTCRQRRIRMRFPSPPPRRV